MTQPQAVVAAVHQPRQARAGVVDQHGARFAVEAGRPGVLAKRGVGWDDLRALKPDLVFCTISGYGAFGPLAEKRGYDLMLQAFAGPMSVTGYPGGTPIRSGVSFIDMSTGLSC